MSEVVSAAFSPDGESVITASDDGTARTWSVASSESTTALGGRTDVRPGGRASRMVSSATFSPDGRSVVTVTNHDQGMARIWNVARGKQASVLRAEGGASSRPPPSAPMAALRSRQHGTRATLAYGRCRVVTRRQSYTVHTGAWWMPPSAPTAARW